MLVWLGNFRVFWVTKISGKTVFQTNLQVREIIGNYVGDEAKICGPGALRASPLWCGFWFFVFNTFASAQSQKPASPVL